MFLYVKTVTNKNSRLIKQQNGNVIRRRESPRKGLNSTSGAQFAALPLVKRAVVS